MRCMLALGLICLASLAFAQEEKKPDPPPVTVVSYDFPREIKVGEEFTFTAKVKNAVGRLALVSLRLQLDDNCQVLPPNDEQAVFVEVGAPRTVAWRVKRVAEGKLNGNVGSFLITLKRGPERSIPADDKTALEKEWEGKFSDAATEFGARLQLQVHPDGAVEGTIRWTLLKHSVAERQKLVGKEGTEYVWGIYDSKSRLLQIGGYRRDDPHAVIGLDRYQLTLSAEGIHLKGSTWNHGTNDGKMSLTPAEE